jgi:hypothetical protein
MSEKSKGDIFLGVSPPPHKPKGLVDALSEIQQYYVVERSGSPIPEDFFTLGGKLAFFEVGFRAAFLSGIVSALLMPFAFGVIERYIPIFGSYNPSLFDRIFAIVLSISFSIAHSVFISLTGKYYIGSISKSAIKNLLGGFISGALLKLVIAFILFHTIYFYFLSQKFLTRNLLKLSPFIKYETLKKVYLFLMEFRPVFLISSYFLIFSTFLMIIIPILSILISSRRTRKEIEREERWA